MQFRHQTDSAERPSDSRAFKAILLVDDNRELVQTLQWILADEQFLVDKAYDGREALWKVKANEYDAVICDMKMPELNGDEFFVQAIAMRPCLVERFIFITGFADDRQVHLFLTQNNLKYLVKPVNIPKLIEYVNALVE